MQIIAIDNLGRDHISDRVIATGLTQTTATARAAELNKLHSGPNASRFYVVKPDEYRPYVFEP